MRIHKEGINSILTVFIIALALSASLVFITGFSIFSIVISSLIFCFAFFIVSFFRIPNRKQNGSSTKVSAPADGKIIYIEEVFENEFYKEKRLKISIFMSVFSVHANWFPITGSITYYKYHPGNYLAAWHPKASDKNERTTIVIENENGISILVRQIAGLIARRVICYTKTDNNATAGEELGFIKFGSRADVYLPLGTKINVKVGDKVVGSETIIAELD